jgi:hypothetical protein
VIGVALVFGMRMRMSKSGCVVDAGAVDCRALPTWKQLEAVSVWTAMCARQRLLACCCTTADALVIAVLDVICYSWIMGFVKVIAAPKQQGMHGL